MARHEPSASPTVAEHLTKQAPEARPWTVVYPQIRMAIGRESRLCYAVIELYILAGIKALVVSPKLLDDAPPICRPGRARICETGRSTEDVRAIVVAKPRMSGRGDRRGPLGLSQGIQVLRAT